MSIDSIDIEFFSINFIDQNVNVKFLGKDFIFPKNTITPFQNDGIIIRVNNNIDIGLFQLYLDRLLVTTNGIAFLAEFRSSNFSPLKVKLIINPVGSYVKIIASTNFLSILPNTIIIPSIGNKKEITLQNIVTVDELIGIISFNDKKLGIRLSVNGTIFNQKASVSIGILPQQYLSVYLDALQIGEILNNINIDIFNGLSLSKLYMIINIQDVVLDRYYKAGFHITGQININPVHHPLLDIPYLFLSENTYISLDIGLQRYYSLFIERRGYTELFSISDILKFEIGQCSVLVENTNNRGIISFVSLRLGGRLTIKDIPRLDGTISDLVINAQLGINISISNSITRLQVSLRLIDPIDITKDITLDTLSLSLESNSNGSITSPLALLRLCIPDSLTILGSISAWGSTAYGEIVVTKQGIGLSTRLEEPSNLINNIIGISSITDPDLRDIFRFLEIINVKYIRLQAATGNLPGYMKGISFEGAVGAYPPVLAYKTGTDIQKIVYALQHFFYTDIGLRDLTIKFLFDANTPKNSSIDIALLLDIKITIANFLFESGPVGLQISANPSMALFITMYMTPPGSQRLTFSFYLRFSTQAITLESSLLGIWRNIFGIQGLSIGNLGFRYDKAYSDLALLPSLAVPGANIATLIKILLPSGLGLAGEIQIQDPNYLSEPPLIVSVKTIITQKVDDIGFEGFLDTGVFNSIAIITDKTAKLFLRGSGLPKDIYDALDVFKIKRLALKFVPTGAKIGDITIEQGFGFEISTCFNSPIINGRFGILGRFNIGQGFYLKGELPQIRLPGIIEMYGTKQDDNGRLVADTNKYPTLEIDINLTNFLNSKISASAYVFLFSTLTLATNFNISRDGFLFQSILESGTGKLNIDVKLPLVDELSLDTDIEISNPGGILLDTATNGVKNLTDSIQNRITTGLQDTNSKIIDFVNTSEKAYQDRESYYNTLTIQECDRRIEYYRNIIIQNIEGGLSAILTNGKAYRIAESNYTEALRQKDIERTRLENQLRDNGINSKPEMVQNLIDEKERQIAEQEALRNNKDYILEYAIQSVRNFFNCEQYDGFWLLIPRGICEASQFAVETSLRVAGLFGTEVLTWASNLVNSIINIINDIKNLINNVLNLIRDAWNAAINAVTNAFNALSSLDLSGIITQGRLLLDAITRDGLLWLKYSFIRLGAGITPITILRFKDLQVPGLFFINLLTPILDGLKAIGINLPFQLEISGYINGLKESLDPLQSTKTNLPYNLPVDFKDITVEFKHIFAILDNSSQDLPIIFNYFFSQLMKPLANLNQLAIYQIKDSPTIQAIRNLADAESIDIAGIKIPTIVGIVKSIIQQVNIENFRLRGKINRREFIIEVVNPFTITLFGNTITILSFRIDVRKIIIEIINKIIAFITSLLKF